MIINQNAYGGIDYINQPCFHCFVGVAKTMLSRDISVLTRYMFSLERVKVSLG